MPDPDFTDYKGFAILDTEPIGAGGQALNANFTTTADHVAQTEGAHGATPDNTPDAIVQRDGSGNVSVGSLTATSLIGTTFTFTQPVPAATWTITHNLRRYPGVTVVDSAGSVVVGDIAYPDDNTVVVSFGGGFSGAAHLN